MEYATILPEDYLHLIADDNYHMALAHLVNEAKPTPYTEFYVNQGLREGSYVILDNGVIEGEPQHIGRILLKAEYLHADEIILPDKLMDCEATLDMSLEALKIARNYNKDLKLMAVPQGATMEEWIDCAMVMLSWDIDCLGIPKILTKIAGRDGRLEALLCLGNFLRGLDVHLLGCWDTPLEMLVIQKYVDRGEIKPIRGVDSAIAYVYAREGWSISQASRPSGAIDFKAHDADVDLLRSNIELWKGCPNRSNNLFHIL